MLRVVVVRIVRGARREVTAVVDPDVLVPVGAVTYLRVWGDVLAIEMAKAVVETVQAGVNEDTKECLKEYFHRGLE